MSHFASKQTEGNESDSRVSPVRRVEIQLTGRVQGVGFRPHVYRLADSLGLVGSVRNTGDGVTIDVQGVPPAVERFVQSLPRRLPPHASIDRLTLQNRKSIPREHFIIESSQPEQSAGATVLPDLATCPECLREITDPGNRRYRYPFTNCTHCGPRYSIIESVPYDRPRTTMKRFTMCPACQAEYDDPRNRRFHAQPNACPRCGPHLELWDARGQVLADREDALAAACDAIRGGRIVALKGLGGFQLLVDARNDEAVARLRKRKHRPAKPFALMFPHLDSVRESCTVSSFEERALESAAAPVVLLRCRDSGRPEIAGRVAPGNPYHGAMLPYTPLHHLLMSDLQFPIVATSGNLSEEPICIDEREALERLQGIADLYLVHNRPIARPLDDSVVQAVRNTVSVLRAARGYAPVTFPLDLTPPSCLATGAHLKNTVAFTAGSQIVVSQHIGDLSGPKSQAAMEAAVEAATHLYDARFRYAACDLHPDYHSTHVARRIEPSPLAVQHHYAHVLSCMVEHGLKPPALGVSWDGTGLGTDGTIWGGEFLLVSPHGFERVTHLRTFPLPGGERAISEPRRSALGLLFEIWGEDSKKMRDLGPVRQFSDEELEVILKMIRGGINTPVTSSAGRLFDGLASLLGLSHVSTFEAEAAMQLQFAAEAGSDNRPYEFSSGSPGDACVIDWEPMLRGVIDDLRAGVSLDTIAARCHHTLVEMIAAVVAPSDSGTVVLTGGCFQNRLLLERTIERLQPLGKNVYWHQRMPANDGGIALGQAAALINKMQSE